MVLGLVQRLATADARAEAVLRALRGQEGDKARWRLASTLLTLACKGGLPGATVAPWSRIGGRPPQSVNEIEESGPAAP